ncbi:hypothetical protein FRC14_006573 [Serendipita sp. 396]|nr:hypothetical protein FRC14_006573 [Serendipita sp. 396]KAG8776514.1 hypothetical protein FRC15_011913 [Serendipita sp. 397]KAG8795879.1 hypothetical protein FRC16_009931 [Serendipita sp. 398]KAG8860178.1 hypothetical protein FRC20_011686 [Serendipita sp. 405]
MSALNKRTVDVLIVGGGPAGLSAAMALSRTRRTVALFDNGQYRNAQVKVMNNVPGFDGTNPADFRKKVQNELQGRYSDTFQYIPRKVLSLRKEQTAEGEPSKFHAEDENQEAWTARKVILATGIKDKLPSIPGFDAIWGRSAIHCVFCHGTETKNQPIAVLLNPDDGQMTTGKALFVFLTKFANLNNHPVTILANGMFGEDAVEPRVMPEFAITEQLLKMIKDRGYKWEMKTVSSIESVEGEDTAHSYSVTFNFKSQAETITVPWVVYMPLTEAPESTLQLLSDPSVSSLKDNFTKPSPFTSVPMGEMATNGFFYKTEIDGVFACGNAGLFMATVAMAVSSGQTAGAGVDNDIGMEDYNMESSKKE